MSEWVLSEFAADGLIGIYVYTYQEFGMLSDAFVEIGRLEINDLQ